MTEAARLYAAAWEVTTVEVRVATRSGLGEQKRASWMSLLDRDHEID